MHYSGRQTCGIDGVVKGVVQIHSRSHAGRVVQTYRGVWQSGQLRWAVDPVTSVFGGSNPSAPIFKSYRGVPAWSPKPESCN